MRKWRPVLTAVRKLWTKKKCICAAAHGARKVLDSICAEIADKTKPTIHVAGQSARKSVPVKRLFNAACISAEPYKGISNKEINLWVGITSVGSFSFGFCCRCVGLHWDEWRQISGGAASSVWGSDLGGGRIGRIGRVFRKSLC